MRNWILSLCDAGPRAGGEYSHLLSLLSNVFICREEENILISKPCVLGAFSSLSFYRELEGDLGVRATSSLVLRGLAPSRVEVLC